MKTRPFSPKNRSLFAVALMAASSLLVAVPTTVAAAPEPQAIEPQNVAGSLNYATAPLIQYEPVSGIYGLVNQTTGGIETIRGCLNKTAGVLSHYYKIEQPKGKVVKAVMNTENFSFVGPTQQVSPDFQLYIYTGVPAVATNIDWNTVRFDNRPTEEVNILTPVGGGAPNAYYINVTIWFGSGCYNLVVNVTDPLDIGPGIQDVARSMVAEVDDTHWYRFFANHDVDIQNYEEVSGWLELTNWNSASPYHIDAIIRIFTEDLGYSPANPIGKPIEKSEADNREIEPFSILAPYTGYYYIMIRLQNTSGLYGWQVDYNLHTNISSIPRMPAGGTPLTHKDRIFDDTDWFWFNMSKAGGTGQNDRVNFTLEERSDDPLTPVNMNLWVFGKRDYFLDFDILNSSYQGDAPYNLTLNPEPRFERAAAQAMYTGIYFVEVENFNNTGNYTLRMVFETPAYPNDFNNDPPQAQVIDWGTYAGIVDQSEDHTDFYKVSAKAGETIEAYAEMPRRTSDDGTQQNATLGLLFVGIYQPGMVLLDWSWNYWYDYLNTTDHLENWTRARATVAADNDYIIEVTALEDGFIGPFQVTPMRTIQILWHMDWNMHAPYTLWVSRLPDFNAFPEPPVIKAPLPDITLQEDELAAGVLNLTSYFDDPDLIRGDRLTYEFAPTPGFNNTSITEVNGLVTLRPQANWFGTNTYTVKARDTQLNSVSQKWNITVVSVNDAPYLVSQTPIRFAEDSGVVVLAPLSNFVNDVDGDALTFSNAGDANVTLRFTNTSILVTTAPDFQTASLGADYPVSFDVSDGTIPTPVRLTLYFNITNALDAPRVLTPNPAISCDEDAACPTLDLNTVFQDPDDPLHKSPMSFYLSGNGGDVGYTIFNGTLTLTPNADWFGGKSMQLIAYKSVNQTLYPSLPVELNLVVRGINDPPRISSCTPFAPDVTLNEGQTRSFTCDAVDPEHLQPSFHWYLAGDKLDTTLSSYTFVAGFGLATGGGSRVMTLRVEADDGTGGLASFQWNVTIVDVPQAPVIAISAPLEGNRGYVTGSPLKFFASAFDPDGDPLTFTWKDSSGATLITGATGNYTFADRGTHRITLTVSDGLLNVSATVNVTVEQATQTQPGFEAPALAGALAVAAGAALVWRRRRVD